MKKITSKLLRESCFQGNLECGLPFIIIPKKGQSKKTAVVSVLYGSTDNKFIPPGGNQEEVPAGIAHFLEHQLFKKTEGDLSQEFARYGAYYNANTGYHSTNYFFTGTDNFENNLEILMRLTSQPYFSAEYVATEKLIIEQELRMYLDIPDVKIYQNLLKNMYHYHPINIEIGGTIDSVRNITPQLLERCYRLFYQPNNMVITLSGDMDPEESAATLNKIWAIKYDKLDAAVKRVVPDEPAGIKTNSASEQMSVARPHLLIGYKDTVVGLKGKDLITHNIINDIMLELLLGHSAEIYNKLYKEGLIDDNFGASYSNYETYGFTIINAETDTPQELYQRLLKEIAKAKKARFKTRDLERIKNKFIGKFISAFNSSESLAMIFSAYYFQKINVFDIPRYIKQISLKDVQERLSVHLDEKYHSISQVHPVSNAVSNGAKNTKS
ncbi:MAG: pitrilysin family protein [Planctomycetota bacterium]